jgi:hypothetical protein
LECYSGISGDMTVAALLDLGATEEHLRRTLGKLPVEGYELKVGRVQKGGLDACDFQVILHEEEHHHHHGHAHRTWRDIEALLDAAGLDQRILEWAKKMFRIVAEAEGKVHGRPMEEVHFHEVGAVDSIVDIVGAAACLTELDVDKILVSDIWEGQGHVRCQHGILPVPVPAVTEIAAAYGLPLKQTDQNGEMVTPTGAAVAALSEGKKPEKFRIEKVGLGAGKKDFPRANVLRAMLIQEEPQGELWMLETNLDDCSGEVMGYTMECLLEAGALDVFFTPIYMKKNRPAYRLSVLCGGEQIQEMDRILFRETTTIGVRRYRVERDILERRMEQVETPYGTAEVKVCMLEGQELRYPEYESVKRICREQGLAYRDVYEMVKEQL